VIDRPDKKRRRGIVGAGVLTCAGVIAAISFGIPATQATPAHVGHNGHPPGKIFQRTELYFGSEKPDGTEVSAEEFDGFVDASVTPRFPDGLTQLTGEGQFLGSTGPIEETSFVVILLYPLDDRSANREIEEIRTLYKGQFQQESVLRDDSQDRVSF